MFAEEIRKKRVAHMRGYTQWRWHSGRGVCENQRQAPLSLACRRSRRGSIGDGCHGEARQGRGSEVFEARHEEIWPTKERRHRRAQLLSRCDERDRQRKSPRSRSSAQQSRRKFASAVSTTGILHAAVSKCEEASEIPLSARPGPQPLQSGASSRHPRSLQTETLGRAGRVARSRGLIAACVWASYAIHKPPAVTLTRPTGGLSTRSTAM